MLPLVKALQRGLRLPQLLLHLHAPAGRGVRGGMGGGYEGKHLGGLSKWAGAL